MVEKINATVSQEAQAAKQAFVNGMQTVPTQAENQAAARDGTIRNGVQKAAGNTPAAEPPAAARAASTTVEGAAVEGAALERAAVKGFTSIPTVGEVLGTAGKVAGPAGVVAAITQEGLSAYTAVTDAKSDGRTANPGQAGTAAVVGDVVGMGTSPVAMTLNPIEVGGLKIQNPAASLPAVAPLAIADQLTGGKVQKALEAAPGMVRQALGPTETERGLTDKTRKAAMERVEREAKLQGKDFSSMPPREAGEFLNKVASKVVNEEIRQLEAKRDASWPLTSERRDSIKALEDAMAANEGLGGLQQEKRQEMKMAEERAQRLGQSEQRNAPAGVRATENQPTGLTREGAASASPVAGATAQRGK
jgi:hypothetical protein